MAAVNCSMQEPYIGFSRCMGLCVRHRACAISAILVRMHIVIRHYQGRTSVHLSQLPPSTITEGTLPLHNVL